MEQSGITGENQKETPDSSIDWENRILCSDGNCIGVIGPDGRCKECGNPYEGPQPAAVSDQEQETEKEAAGQADPQPAGMPSESAGPADDEKTDDATPGDDWENRILCSDGNCIGVIGPDGRCKECGKPYRG